MSVFKRVVSFIFALAGLLAFAALILPWVGPWQQLFTNLISTNGAWLLTVEICSAICIAGLLALLLRAIIARAPKNIVVSTIGGDEITVTRDAIASQASHLIEADGTCMADRVDVRTKSNAVFVRARVLPYESLDIVAKGAELHERLSDGLVAVCGEQVAAINLEFIEPATVSVPESVPEDGFVKADESVTVTEEVPEVPATNSEITLSKPSGTPVTEFFELDATTEVNE